MKYYLKKLAADVPQHSTKTKTDGFPWILLAYSLPKMKFSLAIASSIF